MGVPQQDGRMAVLTMGSTSGNWFQISYDEERTCVMEEVVLELSV